MQPPRAPNSCGRSVERSFGEESTEEALRDLELAYGLRDREPAVLLPVAFQIWVDHGLGGHFARSIFVGRFFDGRSPLERKDDLAPTVDGLSLKVFVRLHMAREPGPGWVGPTG